MFKLAFTADICPSFPQLRNDHVSSGIDSEQSLMPLAYRSIRWQLSRSKIWDNPLKNATKAWVGVRSRVASAVDDEYGGVRKGLSHGDSTAT